MANLDVRKYNDKELLQALDDAGVMMELERHRGWQIIEESCRRIAIDAQKKLNSILPTPENMVAICKLQVVIKLYGGGLLSLKDSFKQEAELAFREAKARNLIRKPQ